MNEDIKNNIFYKPQTEFERNYSTDGIIPDKNTEKIVELSHQEETPMERILEKAEDVIKKLGTLRGLSQFIPEKIRPIYKNIIENLLAQTIIEKEEIDEIVEKDKKDEESEAFVDKYEENITEIIPDDEIEFDEEGFIWSAPQPTNIGLKIIKPKNNKDLARDQYLRDSIYIKEDFIIQMDAALQEYIFPLNTIMKESGVRYLEYLTIDYQGESVAGYSENERHLNDTIVRNQTLIDERSRLMNKTHNSKNTTATMMAFDVVAQERINYYGEEYDLALTDFASMYNRNLLEKSRRDYDFAYYRAKKNMYKYLKSTVMITSDILKASLESASSKCYLLTKEVNIYARKEFNATGYENSASTKNNSESDNKEASKGNEKNKNSKET